VRTKADPFNALKFDKRIFFESGTYHLAEGCWLFFGALGPVLLFYVLVLVGFMLAWERTVGAVLVFPSLVSADGVRLWIISCLLSYLGSASCDSFLPSLLFVFCSGARVEWSE
jgi:hypothetical protein